MIVKIVFIASLFLLLISLFLQLVKPDDPKREKQQKRVHIVLMVLYLVGFGAGTYLLYFQEAHRFLVYSAFNLLVWLVLSGPLLALIAKTPPTQMLHRLAQVVSVVAVAVFLFFIF